MRSHQQTMLKLYVGQNSYPPEILYMILEFSGICSSRFFWIYRSGQGCVVCTPRRRRPWLSSRAR